jgi:hypothetical protein
MRLGSAVMGTAFLAGLGLGFIPSAHAAPSPPHYRLWRTVIHEPGILGITFTDPADVHDVFAMAVDGTENQWTRSGVVTQDGHVFTLYIRIPHGAQTGTWFVTGVWATPAGVKPGAWAPPAADQITRFAVRS